MTQPCAVVTGGAQNIGGAISLRLQQDGFRVIVLDIIPPEHDSLKADARLVDLSDRKATESCVAFTLDCSAPSVSLAVARVVLRLAMSVVAWVIASPCALLAVARLAAQGCEATVAAVESTLLTSCEICVHCQSRIAISSTATRTPATVIWRDV